MQMNHAVCNKVIYGLYAALLMLLGLTAQAAETSRVYVGFAPGQKAAVAASLSRAGGQTHYTFDRLDAFAVSVPTVALKGLSNNPNILYIEDDPKRYLMAESVPYGIAMVQANVAPQPSSPTERAVCIVDSGYSLGHEDLPPTPIVSGTNDAGTGNWYTDENHHGTHVAGTIAALANNTGVVGVLPNSNINLHIVKVFDAAGWAYSSSLVAAVQKCADAGADVVSMSLGGSFKSRTEDRAFKDFDSLGMLSIAAAGNDGNTRMSYPASYSSVVSVAAIDGQKVVADFSQKNSQVELAAPGVAVRSTVPPGTGMDESVTVGSTGYEAIALEASFQGSATGALVDCGIGDAPCAGAGGKVCLIARGTITFAEKVVACQNGGGIAAIIANNAPGLFSGTVSGTVTSIPSVGVSQASGTALGGQLGTSAKVTVQPGNYAYFDGTSMATPHVSGVAALVWAANPGGCTNADIRAALTDTAEDLGVPGRDDSYGYGLVQAAAAITSLSCGGGSGGGGGGGTCTLGAVGDACTSNSDCCSSNCKGKPGNKVCK